MTRIRVFISSVQNEFSDERKELFAYLQSDPLLGKFFEPFIFEAIPASGSSPQSVYLKEVESSNIYLGLFGKEYGYEDKEGVSPTEREFDHASILHKTRLIFLKNVAAEQQHPKIKHLINKAQQVIVRKKFSTLLELKTAVYASLIKYLEENEFIRLTPFDATLSNSATIEEIDKDKIQKFIRIANQKRGFPLDEFTPIENVLNHLNLTESGKIRNAAFLLFGKTPQRFFINTEIRCAYFHGYQVSKPIPSYKVLKGDVFELIEQAKDFILSKLDYSIGTRETNISIPGKYEIPLEIISEAIVNAVAHRDYLSNASIQIMMFRDRIEIWNPGQLPMGWTTETLKRVHTSIPRNPLLAEPMYLMGYIERLGTGTMDMIRIAKDSKLAEPQFIQEDDFRVIISRPVISGEATGEVSGEVSGEVPETVKKLIFVVKGEMRRSEIQKLLNIKHDDYFRLNYIIPAIEEGFIEMKFPDNPNHPQQKYRLTQKGMKYNETEI